MSVALQSNKHAQKKCCTQSALKTDSAYCTTCGEPLFRCVASAECGALLDASGRCPVCVDIELSLDAGAASSVCEGGKLALPLRITNASRVDRPLMITSLWMKEDDGKLREISLPFERLEPGDSANVGIRTGQLEYAGMHQVDLLVAVASRYEWREEAFIFSSSIIFPVESAEANGSVMNVNVNAEEVGAGFTIYNPTRIENDRKAGLDTGAHALPLKVIRADRLEREFNKRGYENGLIVHRSVNFNWLGFDAGDAPFNGPIVRTSGVLCCGRNATNAKEGSNDVRISAGADAENEKFNLSISRQHFTLYIESGRLMLRVDSQFGLKLNGQSLERTKTALLNDGDIIQPSRRMPEKLGVQINFETQRNVVKAIIVRRVVET